MRPEKIQSMRALARELHVSVATVSDALRNNPRVNIKTRERVVAAARAHGYKYNPLAGSVMSEIRRSHVGSYRGTTAVIDLEDPTKRRSGEAAYHDLILQGAQETAERLGYNVDVFFLPVEGLSVKRLNGILESRGIHGLLILPSSLTPDLSALDWSRTAGVYCDYLIDSPPLHRVFPNHFKSMTIAAQKLLDFGYKRPGLVVRAGREKRILFRWEAALQLYWTRHSKADLIDTLVFDELDRDAFVEWFHANQPDVVLSHHREIVQWMTELGCEVPETHGFCCLNRVVGEMDASGLDLRPRLVGARAMEMLVAQLQRSEFGIPEVPSLLTFEGEWCEGNTLRPQLSGSKIGDEKRPT